MKKFKYILPLLTLITACGAPLPRPQAPVALLRAFSQRDGDHHLLSGRLSVNGLPQAVMDPGAVADLSFRFFEHGNGAPLTEFERDHDKYMHLIAVSGDLSTFAHLHPDLEKGGIFRIVVNRDTPDPDNQHAVQAISKSGPYLLFGELKPKGQPTRETRLMLTARGNEAPEPLVPDPQQGPRYIEKYFTAAGQPGQMGDPYRLTLQYGMADHGKAPMLHLNFQVFVLRQGDYEPVQDIQPWLGMKAHAVMIGQQGSTSGEKEFRHLHVGNHDHGRQIGPNLQFMLTHVPPADRYKLWLQFKRQGQILTLPFVFQLP